jgi:hypothetical protein
MMSIIDNDVRRRLVENCRGFRSVIGFIATPTGNAEAKEKGRHPSAIIA